MSGNCAFHFYVFACKISPFTRATLTEITLQQTQPTASQLKNNICIAMNRKRENIQIHIFAQKLLYKSLTYYMSTMGTALNVQLTSLMRGDVYNLQYAP